MSNFDAIFKAAKERKPEQEIGSSPDLKTKQAAQVESKTTNTLPANLLLQRILERETNTKELTPSHVGALAESIAVLGLLEPLVVDTNDRLLAGGHRLAAINLVKQQNPTACEQHFPNGLIPVRVMPFDAVSEPDRALQVEVAENEHRRDYTPAEVRALADRLRTAGYVDQPGRPVKGTKALRPALEVIVGKSLRTVQRYLNQNEKSLEKPRQDVMVSEQKLLKQALKRLQDWRATTPKPKTAQRKVLVERLPQIMELLEAVINETDG